MYNSVIKYTPRIGENYSHGVNLHMVENPCFRRSFRQSYRNLHKFCSFRWGTKICPNWPMVTWSV